MSSLTQIVDGLATRLATIAEFDQNVLTVVRRPVTYPAAIIVPPAIPKYGTSLAGQGATLTVTVLVLTGTIDAEQQAELWPFLDWIGPASVAAAINADRKLGLSDVEARVISAEQSGSIELPDGTVAYGVAFTLNILAS